MAKVERLVLTRDSAIGYLGFLGCSFVDGIIVIPRFIKMGLKKWACVDCLINHHGLKGWRWAN